MEGDVASDPFDVVDVARWSPAGDEQLGTKPKQWLRDLAGERWLWKAVTVNRSAAGEYHKGDDWAERIVTEVARSLGVPVATTELAKRGSEVGTVSLSVIDEHEELVHGNELLAEIGVIGADTHDRTGYDLDAVHEALDSVRGHRMGNSAFDGFVGYLVVDAVVGNTDRHQENWAAIEDESRERRLAPSFDHASSLGFALSDDDKAERLTTRDRIRTPEGWASRARSRFEGQPHPVEIAMAGLTAGYPSVASDLVGRLRELDIARIVDRVPLDRMSQPARDFAVRVAETNRARLLSHPTLTMEP